MHCPQCKAEVTADALFCSKCGEKLVQPDSANARQNGYSIPAAETPAEKFTQAASTRMNVQEEPEVELWSGNYSYKAMIGNWIASGLAGVALIVIAVLWTRSNHLIFWLLVLAAFLPGLYNLAVVLYRKISVHYQLTNQRFIHEAGFLRRVTNRIEVLDMDDISYEQGIVERMMGVGSIRIHSSDVSHPQLFLRGIENVAEISNLIDNTRRTERRKRGLHIENI